MSGSEDDMLADDRDDDTKESEEEQLRLRALIETVRPCPALYAKSKKEYCGKGFNKDLAWNTVGQAQVPPLSGKEAKETFYKVRQRFGKEWRKFMTHQKGKSGQGATAPFVSTWPLFEDLRFLGDHITPRKSKSTYKSTTTTPIPRTSQAKKSLLNLSSSSSSAPSPASDGSVSSLWNNDLEIMTGSGSNQVLTSEESDFGPSNPSASEQVLKAMEKAAKSSTKRVPEPDSFASKRQKADKEFMDTMIAQGNALTKVASAFEKALVVPTPTTAVSPPSVLVQPEPSPILAAIKFALDSVPDENKLSCMTDVLTLISTKYAKK